jgi:hypothetical protein
MGVHFSLCGLVSESERAVSTLASEVRLLHHKVLAICIQLAEFDSRRRLVVGFLFVYIFCCSRTCILQLCTEFLRTLIVGGVRVGRGPIENMWVLFLHLLKHFGAVLRRH